MLQPSYSSGNIRQFRNITNGNGEEVSGVRKPNRRAKNHLRFDEERALAVFTALAELWRKRQGFFANLVAPQQRYTPETIRENPWLLGHWFFAMSLPMRGGIDSEAAFRFMRGLWERSAEFFNPQLAMDATPEELIAAIKATAQDVHESVNGQKQAGTLSYKLEEHVGGWIQNSRALVEHWGGDIRNVFWGVTDFEEAFRRIDAGRNAAGFVGMQRKIFSLLTMWLQEFGLIREFPLPLIVDFHAMRFLVEQQIVLPRWSPLGPGKSKREDRKRPGALWHYPAAKVTEQFVNRIIAWSLGFFARHGLSPYDVSHAIWFLSRELCAAYQGNRSFSVSKQVKTGKTKARTGVKKSLPLFPDIEEMLLSVPVEGGEVDLVDEGVKNVRAKRSDEYSLTARLLTDEELRKPTSWSKGYRDPCRLCPVEQTCTLRIPAGPSYDWGVLVDAGRHIVYPSRSLLLPGVEWERLPGSFGRNATKRTNSP